MIAVANFMRDVRDLALATLLIWCFLGPVVAAWFLAGCVEAVAS